MQYVEDFADALRATVREYLQTLSPLAPTDIHHVRLEASGAGVTVIYAENGAEAAPSLQVSLTGLGETQRGKK